MQILHFFYLSLGFIVIFNYFDPFLITLYVGYITFLFPYISLWNFIVQYFLNELILFSLKPVYLIIALFNLFLFCIYLEFEKYMRCFLLLKHQNNNVIIETLNDVIKILKI
jgi:hypothetical protein